MEGLDELRRLERWVAERMRRREGLFKAACELMNVDKISRWYRQI